MKKEKDQTNPQRTSKGAKCNATIQDSNDVGKKKKKTQYIIMSQTSEQTEMNSLKTLLQP